MVIDLVGFFLFVDYKEYGCYFFLIWNIIVIKNDVDMLRKLYLRSFGG